MAAAGCGLSPTTTNEINFRRPKFSLPKFSVSYILGCSANFVEQNPYETRNTNLISLDVATKLLITNHFPNFVYESGVTKFTRKLHQIPSKKSRNFQENSCFYQSRYRSTKIQKILFSRIQPYETLDYASFPKFRLRKWRVRNWLSTPVLSLF